MFCVHCGKEISDNSKFCRYCGGVQPEGDRPDIGGMIDKAGDTIGSGIDDAVNDFRDEIKSNNEAITKKMAQAEENVENVRKNWKDYLTLENMEEVAVLALALPLFMGVVNIALGIIFGLFFRIPVLRAVFRFLLVIIRLIFVLASAAGVGSIAYLLVKCPSKRNVWSYITAAGDVLAFFACLGIMFNWKGVPVAFGLICLVYGIDCISRVILRGKGVETQPEVSEDMSAYKSWYDNYKKENPVEKTTAVAYPAGSFNAENTPVSYFDGNGLTLFGMIILTVLVCGVTCGLAAPWMICKIMEWRKTHTVIDGKRLAFTGTGGSLFGHWILWEILCVITCGIYTFFLHVALRRWEMQHTTYADDPTGMGQFDGDSFQYFGYGLLQGLLLMISCGLAAPWTITMIQKWEMKHSIVVADRMKYEGTALGLLGQYIIVFLLSAITCGIYSSWGIVRINKYVYSHTHVDA